MWGAWGAVGCVAPLGCRDVTLRRTGHGEGTSTACTVGSWWSVLMETVNGGVAARPAHGRLLRCIWSLRTICNACAAGIRDRVSMGTRLIATVMTCNAVEARHA